MKRFNPRISFLIPTGGSDRVVQFRLALAAARAQIGIDVEIIVIEQSPEPTLRGHLPADVTYIHQSSEKCLDFNKSRALNRGAQEASADNLVILDADLLVPQRFAVECARVLAAVEAARPARWIAYLDPASTNALDHTQDTKSLAVIGPIISNTPMPLAIRRSTYWDIGGHDESYVGWGGEDTEFLDRLRTRNISEGGWMPILHAWHAPAQKKASGERNQELHASIMAESPNDRVRRLVSATPGNSTYRHGATL